MEDKLPLIYCAAVFLLAFTAIVCAHALLKVRGRVIEAAAIKEEWNNTSEMRAATFALKGRAEG